jgi:hypothetical protein
MKSKHWPICPFQCSDERLMHWGLLQSLLPYLILIRIGSH